MENEKLQELKPRNNPTTKLSTEGYGITREQRLGYAKKKEKKEILKQQLTSVRDQQRIRTRPSEYEREISYELNDHEIILVFSENAPIYSFR